MTAISDLVAHEARLLEEPVLPNGWEYVRLGPEPAWPWRPRRDSLLTPEDHAEMLEGLVAVVEAFDLLGAVA